MTTLFRPAILATLVLLASACSQEKESAEHPMPASELAQTSSSAGLPAGRIAEGEKLATTKGKSGQACADCHGKDGNTPLDPSYPKLGGQYADYLEHSLQGYRDGMRDHAIMGPQAKELTDQQISDLSAYFASQPGQLRDLSHM